MLVMLSDPRQFVTRLIDAAVDALLRGQRASDNNGWPGVTLGRGGHPLVSRSRAGLLPIQVGACPRYELSETDRAESLA